MESPQLLDFVDLYLEHRESGRQMPLSYYLERFPAIEAEVAREFRRLEDEQKQETSSRRRRDWAAQPPTDVVQEKGSIGHYRLLHEIGSGGQGTVFLAEDTRVQRKIALKCMSGATALLSDSRRERFEREAKLLARLDHPGICTVHDTGMIEGTPFIAMAYVAGGSLADRIRAVSRFSRSHVGSGESASWLCAPSKSVGLRALLHFFERAARALHSAHEAGVVHRDIKPANIMVSHADRPVLLDFGLAREEDSRLLTLTRPGEVFGTPAYMAPEQLRNSKRIDRRADIYSLAVSIFEALTLELPYPARSAHEQLRAIETQPIADPRKLNPIIPSDLAVVLATALDKEPDFRYATALDLAEDLRRVREFEPILARPASITTRILRWVQRHPAVAASLGAAFLALAGGLIQTQYLLGNERTANERRLGEQMLAQALLWGDEGSLSALYAAWLGHQYASGFQANSCMVTLLDKFLQVSALKYEIGTGFACSEEPTRVAVQGQDGTLQVWDPRSGQLKRRFEQPFDGLRSLALNRSATRLAAGYADGKVRLWNSDTGQSRECRSKHEGAVLCLEFSPNGQWLASGSEDGSVGLWDTATAVRRHALTGHVGRVDQLIFGPSGQKLLSFTTQADVDRGSSDHAGIVWSVDQGRKIADLQHENHLDAAVFTPDGHSVYTGSADRTVVHWDLSESPGTPLAKKALPNRIHSLAFDPHHERLAVGFGFHLQDDRGGRGLWLLDSSSLEELRRLDTHQDHTVSYVEFSSDGKRLLSADWGRQVVITDLDSNATLLRVREQPDRRVRWLHKPKQFLVASSDKIYCFDLTRARTYIPALSGHSGPVRDLACSPDGRFVATACEDGQVRVWGFRDRQLLHSYDDGEGVVADLEIDPSGRWLAAGWADGSVSIWQMESGTRLCRILAHQDAVQQVRFHPEGHQLLTTSADGTARLWAVDEEAALLAELDGHKDGVRSAAFRPTPPHEIATADGQPSVRIWNPRSGKVIPWPWTPKWSHQNLVYNLYFSADGRWLAATCEDLRVRLWDMRNPQREPIKIYTTDPEHIKSGASDGKDVQHAGFIHGGRTLVQVRRTAMDTRYYSLVEKRLETSIPLGQTFTECVAFSSTGTLAIGGRDGTLLLFDALEKSTLYRVKAHSRPIRALCFSADESMVLTAAGDGLVKFWPVEPATVFEKAVNALVDPVQTKVNAENRLRAAGISIP